MSKVSNVIRATLLASAFGLALTALPASAQQIDGTGDAAESVVVHPPGIVYESHPLELPGTASLSRPVSSDGLDLRTHAGAQAFRMRVTETVRGVCDQLREADPVKELPMEQHCFANGESNAMVRADAAIRDARWNG